MIYNHEKFEFSIKFTARLSKLCNISDFIVFNFDHCSSVCCSINYVAFRNKHLSAIQLVDKDFASIVKMSVQLVSSFKGTWFPDTKYK